MELGEPEIAALSPKPSSSSTTATWRAATRTLPGTTTFLADDANWRVQGFPGNPWRLGTSQFKRNFIDHEVNPDSAFRVAYRFDVDPDYPSARRARLNLAVEPPLALHRKINRPRRLFRQGPSLVRTSTSAFFRWAAGSAPARIRSNSAPREFHMLCEIKPVYILGDFALEPAAKGFRIVAPRPLSLGDWTAQGLPFYPHGVRYTWRFALPRVGQASCLPIPDVQAGRLHHIGADSLITHAEVSKLRLELGAWARIGG